MPEEKTQALQKLHRWRDHNPELADTVPLAEQMKAVGIEKICAGEMAALLQSERITDTISVQAIAEESSSGAEGATETLTGNLLSDRGESADRARAAVFEDPRMAVLRPSFSSLAPLHQALLAAMYCCEATEGGDLTWLRNIADRGHEVLRTTVQRLSSGVASQAQIATSVSTTYSA